MPMFLTPGFLSKNTYVFIWLKWLYGSVSNRYISLVANLMALELLFLKSQLIVIRSGLKYVSVHLHQGQIMFEFP